MFTSDHGEYAGAHGMRGKGFSFYEEGSRVPLIVKEKCIGVFDLESPDLCAFNKKHVELLTLLASQAAVAIDNARLYERLRANEARFESELRFAGRVQAGLLPQELPKRLKGADVAWHFDAAQEIGGDLYEFLSPEQIATNKTVVTRFLDGVPTTPAAITAPLSALVARTETS